MQGDNEHVKLAKDGLKSVKFPSHKVTLGDGQPTATVTDTSDTVDKTHTPIGRKRRKYHNEDQNYFRSYSDISIHQEMIADEVRTKTYRYAILKNFEKIRGKVVADVGAGTGILSVFCCQAGAKKVYAIEASDMADQARLVVAENKLQEKITVIQGKVEEVELPEKVDVIVSEWMGYFLFYESMLPSVLYARDKWLKEGGIMLPSKATLYCAPVNDEEHINERLKFWETVEPKYEVKMQSLVPYSRKCLTQHVHVLGLCGEDILAHAVQLCSIDLVTMNPADLNHIKTSFNLKCFGESRVDGLAVWFDVSFPHDIKLHTSPYHPLTHWQQCVIYFDEFIKGKQDTEISGNLEITPNTLNNRFLDILLENLKENETCRCQRKVYNMTDFLG